MYYVENLFNKSNEHLATHLKENDIYFILFLLQRQLNCS